MPSLRFYVASLSRTKHSPNVTLPSLSLSLFLAFSFSKNLRLRNPHLYSPYSLETMSDSGDSNPSPDNSFPHNLTSKTSFFNLKLYVLIGIVILSALALSLLIYILCIYLKRTSSSSSRRRRTRPKHKSGLIPLVSKEIVEIKSLDRIMKEERELDSIDSLNKKGETEPIKKLEEVVLEEEEEGVVKREKKVSGESDELVPSGDAAAVEMNIGWGRWYSLRELEIATSGFDEENVIGEGGYGVVYRGVLNDGSVVAVKNLLNNK